MSRGPLCSRGTVRGSSMNKAPAASSIAACSCNAITSASFPSSTSQGAKFYRIVRNWINQGGVETDSVWGGRFADDAGGLALKHDRKVCLLWSGNGSLPGSTCNN